jgi:hypothetical protein
MTPLNLFFLPPDSSDRLLRGLRPPQAEGASVWAPNSNRRRGSTIPSSGWGGGTYLVLEIESEIAYWPVICYPPDKSLCYRLRLSADRFANT